MHALDDALDREIDQLDTVLLRLTTLRLLMAAGKHHMVDRAVRDLEGSMALFEDAEAGARSALTSHGFESITEASEAAEAAARLRLERHRGVFGPGGTGQGVSVDAISRATDALVSANYRETSAQQATWDTRANFCSRAEQVLGPLDGGASQALSCPFWRCSKPGGGPLRTGPAAGVSAPPHVGWYPGTIAACRSGSPQRRPAAALGPSRRRRRS